MTSNNQCAVMHDVKQRNSPREPVIRVRQTTSNRNWTGSNVTCCWLTAVYSFIFMYYFHCELQTSYKRLRKIIKDWILIYRPSYFSNKRKKNIQDSRLGWYLTITLRCMLLILCKTNDYVFQSLHSRLAILSHSKCEMRLN